MGYYIHPAFEKLQQQKKTAACFQASQDILLRMRHAITNTRKWRPLVLHSFTVDSVIKRVPLPLYVSLRELGKGKKFREKPPPLYVDGWTWPSAEEEEEKLAKCRGILKKTKQKVQRATRLWISVSFKADFYLDEQEQRRKTEFTGDIVVLFVCCCCCFFFL